MKIKTNGKEFEIFEDIGAGAMTVFDAWAKRNIDGIRIVGEGINNEALTDEDRANTVSGMRIICERIAKADIIDFSWDEWFSIFACQSKPVMTVEDFNRWTSEEVDGLKKKLLQALNPSLRLELHLKRLKLFDLVYSTGKTAESP